MPEWVEFDRTDAGIVIEMVRRVALSGDPGAYGEGVEVVIEVPRGQRRRSRSVAEPRTPDASLRGFFAGLFHDDPPEQARIAVTRTGGEVRYPFHVQLVTPHGGDAARRVPALPGWARSNSAGLAFLMQKGRTGDRYEWAGLVGGAVAALHALASPPDTGWRAIVASRSGERSRSLVAEASTPNASPLSVPAPDVAGTAPPAA